MKLFRWALALAAACPVIALGAACQPPAWERLTSPAPLSGPQLRVNMRPLLSLSIPAGVREVSASAQGAISFRGSGNDDASVLLMLENEQMAQLHERPTPHALFMAIFKGSDAAGCDYLRKGFQLGDQDHLLHLSRTDGVDIYAWGRGGEQRFYVLDAREPESVLVGALSRMNRRQLEGILASIEMP